MVKQNLLEKMDMDLAACQKVIFWSPDRWLQPGSKIDTAAVYTGFFLMWKSYFFLPLFQSLNTWQDHDVMFCTWGTRLQKVYIAYCCVHSPFSAWLISVSLIVTTAMGVQNVAFGLGTFSHSSAGRKGKLRSTRKEYHCVLSEIVSMVSHILELRDLLLKTMQYSAPSKWPTWKFFMF